ncbi:MAG: glycosyltransferase family 4 protein [Phycisphaerae bacterium]|nr:glycosyltransferase family 4 protein [Tepidisphaeraceae bacterium]
MNIALLASQYHPHVGGVEELVRQLALEYRRRGHHAIVFANRWPRSLPVHEVIDGVPVYRPAFRTPDACWRSRVTYALSHRLVRAGLHRVLRTNGIEVLHVQCVSANAHYALGATRRLGLPLVTTLQGELTMDATRVFERSPFARQTLRDALAGSAAVTACSQDTLAEAQTFFGDPLGARARVIYNGINLTDFAAPPSGPRPARPYVLGIGRHVAQKGFDVLIRAFALAALPTHDLVIAGDGPERPALAELARSLGVGDRVRIPGKADRPTAIDLFQQCETFVLPSRHEPMGIVNLEAMAAGKPVVATRVGGVPEVVTDGVTGLLVEPANPDALATALRQLSADAGLRTRLGNAGRLRAEAFAWPAVADQYLSLYAEAIQGAAAPATSRAHVERRHVPL